MNLQPVKCDKAQIRSMCMGCKDHAPHWMLLRNAYADIDAPVGTFYCYEAAKLLEVNQ